MVEEKQVYKSTLVSDLNGNPTLSKDQLTRVRSASYFSLEEKVIDRGGSWLGIGSDCAIFFETHGVEENAQCKRKGKPNKTSHGVQKGQWYLGRVIAMRSKVENGWKERKHSLDLLDRPTNTEIDLIMVPKGEGNTVLYL